MTSSNKIHIRKKKIVVPTSRKKRVKALLISFFKQNKQKLPYVAGALVLIIGSLVFFISYSPKKKIADQNQETTEEKKTDNKPLEATKFRYPDLLPDFAMEANYKPVTQIIEQDISLNEFFRNMGLKKYQSEEIAFQAKFEQLNTFKKYQTLYTFRVRDIERKSKNFFIYQISMDTFAVITLTPKPMVELKTISLNANNKEHSGIVKDRFFWGSFMDNGGEYKLLPKVLDALKWKIDFYHVKPNDKYKLIYEEVWHGNQQIGIGNLLAIVYCQDDKNHYAFRFEEEGKVAYFDEYGQTMKLRFLKSPVEYDIINSPFGERFHPIYKTHKMHLGTDYYAKLDDPVFAVGDGRIVKAEHKKNNGNYVKIKHDDKYQSQYLHLNKFGRNIRVGTYVKQGDIIGYAGKTGLATGVHVCFRFWVNNQQVDFTKEEVYSDNESGNSVRNIKAFKKHLDSLKIRLDKMILN